MQAKPGEKQGFFHLYFELSRAKKVCFCCCFVLFYVFFGGGVEMAEGSKGTKVDGDKEEEAVHLRREIGLLPAVCFIIGTVVGSGIFIAPKGVLMNSGSVGLSLLVWVLCGVLSLFGEAQQ